MRGRRVHVLIGVTIFLLLFGLGLVFSNPTVDVEEDYAPRSGALFGGAINVDSERDDEFAGNPRDVELRQTQLCRKYDNLNYYLYGVAVNEAQFENVRWAIDDNETPIVTLSWPHRMPTNPQFIPLVAKGRYDTEIATTANRIKALGGRVILRPFWEFNHADNGLGAANYDGDYQQFIDAWQRTHAIFKGDASTWRTLGISGTPIQADNIRFSWTPGNARPNNVVEGVNEDYRPYYPGDQYVDWIGIDSYTGNRMVYFRDVFEPPTQLVDWYATYAPKGKPMSIGEIGIRPQSTYPSRSPTRSEWYANARAAIKGMPMIKLFSYFDVSNETHPLAESYQVDAPSGIGPDSARRALAAYSALANDPYFHQGSAQPGCGGSESDEPAKERSPFAPPGSKAQIRVRGPSR